MKIIRRICCSLAALLLSTTLGFAQAPQLDQLDVVERSVPDGPVALVDGAPISREDFLRIYKMQRMALGYRLQNTKTTTDKELQDSDRVLIGIQCLKELVQRQIWIQEGHRRKLSVSEAEVLKAYDETIQSIQDQEETRSGKRPTEEEVMQQARHTREGFLEETRKALLGEKALDAIINGAGIVISDAEIQAFYEERKDAFLRPGGIHIKQIMIIPKPSAAKATEEQWKTAELQAKKAINRVRAGESFEAVARSMSEGRGKEKGGDMGMIPVNVLPEFLREIADALEPGDMSDIFRSELGWQIIKLVAREGNVEISLDKARTRIEELLKEAKSVEVLEAHTQPILRDKGRVQVFLQLEKTLAATADAAS
jgi:parvulin-like peptidyl-prolyl isomerase